MNASAASHGAGGRGRPHLVLLLAANAPRSRRARDNLASALQDTETDLASVNVEEVDVLREPLEALRLGIFATPALVWTRGTKAEAVLYGDLSDDAALRLFLAGRPDGDEEGE